MEHKSYNNKITIKNISSTNAIILGYASIFNVLDQHNDIVKKGAFLNSCDPTKVKLLLQHDFLKPLGTIQSLVEDDYGLKIEAMINSKVNYGKETIELLKQGAINGLSIGFYVRSANYNELGQKIITEVDLKEISVVTFPANEYAQVSNIKDLTNQNEDCIAMNLKTKSFDEKFKHLEEKINSIKNFLSRPEYPLENSEYKDAFNNYLRKGLENDLLTKSSLSSDQDIAGALITPSIYEKIISEINAVSPMRQLASIETISTNALDVVVEENKFVSGWIGESDEREVTDSPKLKQHKIQVHELYAQPKATQRLIDDSAVQIENWITERLKDSFVKSENDAFINGNGQQKPVGILYSVLNDNRDSIFTPNEREINADMLLKLISLLGEEYLANATFLMNRATLSIIQGLKDTTGRFIWQPSLSDSLKQSIFGIPVICCSEMPGPTRDNTAPIILGDIKSAYKIVDRSGISVMRDPYTDKPFVKFYAVKRVGADLVNHNACRVLSFQ